MILSDALKGVSYLGVDTAPIIYLVERHPTYLHIVRAIFTLIESGSITAFTSNVSLTEVLIQPYKTSNTKLAQEYEDILTDSPNFTLVPLTNEMAKQAARLRAQYNLKTPDALQIAAALAAGCTAFVTNDYGMQRVKELRVLVLDELELDLPTTDQIDE